MSKKSEKHIEEKIEQSLKILKSIGLPKQQHNDRSALTLIALLGLEAC